MTLTEKIQHRILDLQAERDRLDALITELQTLVEDGEPEDAGAEVGLGNGHARVARTPPKPGWNGKHPKPKAAGSRAEAAEAAEARRLEVAKLLRTELLRTAEIHNRTGIPPGSMGGVLDHEWFEKDGPERTAPWKLTPAGLAAVERPSRPSRPSS